MTGYTLSRRAEQDLIDIYIYTYHKFGERQAERYTRDLHARFALLAEFPRIGSPAKVGNISCFKFPSGSHTIYYQCKDGDIVIGRVLHAAQDPSLAPFEEE